MGRANIISATMPGSPTQWSPIRSFPLNSSSHGKMHCYTKSQGTDIYSLTTKCPFLQRVLAVTVFTDLLANDLFFGGGGCFLSFKGKCMPNSTFRTLSFLLSAKYFLKLPLRSLPVLLYSKPHHGHSTPHQPLSFTSLSFTVCSYYRTASV